MAEENPVAISEIPEEKLRIMIEQRFRRVYGGFNGLTVRANHAAIMGVLQNELNRRLLERILSLPAGKP